MHPHSTGCASKPLPVLKQHADFSFLTCTVQLARCLFLHPNIYTTRLIILLRDILRPASSSILTFARHLATSANLASVADARAPAILGRGRVTVTHSHAPAFATRRRARLPWLPQAPHSVHCGKKGKNKGVNSAVEKLCDPPYLTHRTEKRG